ncbi:TPA: NAD(P)H-quinone oxidoreductase subunit 3 [Campylobacter upsaliensis]|uniref:NAD(P)H-quinone oxidoreductase subunit 3 n=1 Tax=Campylobacter upsaliensis TaxID=28080 RepID=UPI00128AC83C|nr:NAD(P)H-quinone oxidoreductase subunit 3 [Campylobacter upsaliensis]EHB5117898.1 NAD(P)H-quinone oxidoreductase subunit 3 [Campylobacter upsaliensis]HEC1542624.1 NAD(P)H-quinone oxidoreductase subunit 3 [Campylobacter upsaliensis]HEC1545831.1 NAD(P)H-quinone oxidoreductase subunit 3 [Campylobacter upsaliensis]HEC1554549.1 NAD(P)H-quinone oxidoreductase subunit 3 [Campylobacter upsaliensis]HEC1566425.1 NAD(P)H-quinone oxidoreductase subunit 3 [Campylobacter upsaliensis]
MTHMSVEHPYLGIFIMLILSCVIFFGLVFLASKIGNHFAARNRKRLGLGIYECGPIPVKQANKINSQFFVFALIFILLDIEVVFLFPWALIFRDLGWFGLLEIVIFLALLAVGFLYAYKKGGFRWQSIK